MKRKSVTVTGRNLTSYFYGDNESLSFSLAGDEGMESLATAAAPAQGCGS